MDRSCLSSWHCITCSALLHAGLSPTRQTCLSPSANGAGAFVGGGDIALRHVLLACSVYASVLTHGYPEYVVQL